MDFWWRFCEGNFARPPSLQPLQASVKKHTNKFEAYQEKIYFCLKPKKMKVKDKNINRIRVILAEKDKKNFWLAKKLGVNQATVSQWCTNSRQPSLYTLANIAEILDVDVRQLINSTK